jgi:hypothetical protein
MSPRYPASALLLLLPLTACDGRGPGGGTSGAVRDSAGITIVENAAPAWSEGDAWTLSAEPALAMGASEGDPDHEFYRIAGATRLSDGTIVVANAGTHQLRYYAPDGALRQSAGRKGGGPGEFEMLMTLLGVPGDSVLTLDMMNRRMSLFDAGGRHVRDFGASDAAIAVPMLVLGRLDDGTYAAQATNMRIGPAMLERKAGPARDSVYVLALDAAGLPTDTIGLFPGPRMDVAMIELGGRSMPMPIPLPFSPTTVVAAGRDRFFVGVSDTYEIRVYTPAGELTSLIRRRHEPRRVTEEEVAETRARLTEMLEGQANPFAAQFQEAYAKVSYPETMPAFAELLVDRDGNLWVADAVASQREVHHWSVFDRDGVWLGSVTTPARLNVREIGPDYVLGSASDDLETERVLMYALIKPGSTMP